jgi:hypothetical protein
MPRRSGGPKFYISLQRYYYSGLNMVEITSGGMDYAGADMLVESRACSQLGCGRTYADPREAVEAAYKVAKQWKLELRAKRSLKTRNTKSRLLPRANSKHSAYPTKKDIKVYLSLGISAGSELEPMSLQECRQKAEEIYEKLPKCDRCSALLGDEHYLDYNGIGDSKFCSENCSLESYLADLRENVIVSVREQVLDDPRTHGDGDWSCKLHEDGHVVTFQPNVGEKLTWEVHPDTHEIKTEEEINPTIEHSCECDDSSCPVHEDSEECPNPGTVLLHRIDMGDDDEGSYFCEACAEDALSSGVFSVVEEDGDE